MTCKKCSLWKSSTHNCIMGHGPKNAGLMIIGEAPGAKESETGLPFQGKAGKLLDQYLREAGVDRKEVYVTNVCKCRPPGNRTPTPKEMEACKPHLLREIMKVKPKRILLLGASAVRGVTGERVLKNVRGKWITQDGIKIMSTYHPAAILRNPGWGVSLSSDINKFVKDSEEINIDQVPFTFCRTRKDLEGFINDAKKAVLHSYDIETVPGTSKVICHSSTFEFKDGSTRSYFIPLYHPESPFRKKWEQVIRFITKVLEGEEPFNAITIAQNGKFDDKHHLINTGIRPRLDFDTMLASHLLDENSPHDLGYLATTWLGVPSWKEDVDKMNLINEKLNKVAMYNVRDTFYLIPMYKKMRASLRQDGRLWTLFNRVLMPAASAYEMGEVHGVYLHLDQVEKMTRIALNNMHEAKEKMKEHMPDGMEFIHCGNCRRYGNQRVKIQCPHPEERSEMFSCKQYMEPKEFKVFNFNSPQQMAWLLFEELEMEPVEYTNSDPPKPSTAEDTLVYLDHPIIEHILFYREWQKLYSTYLRPWAELADEEGRIYVSAKLHGTVTGRLAYSKPSPQTVPRNAEIRSCIGAPPGWKLCEFDYSQVELRLVAHVSNEPTMTRIYQTNGDIHIETACIITGKRPEDITEDERKKAKAVNFGFVYGMGWRKFIQYAKTNYGVDFTPEEAKRIRKRFFQKYRGLQPWHDRQRRIVQQLGYVRSLVGRKRRLPEVYSHDEGVQAEALRQSINSPVQACPPDFTHMALAKLDKVPGMWEECFFIFQVHDAILFEIREDVVDKWVPIIKDAMENLPLKRLFGVEMSVPIVVDAKVGDAWGKGQKWKEAA